MSLNNNNETHIAITKIILAWLGAMFGGITLSGLVLTATLIFTVLQIIVLLRKLARGEA